MSDTVKLVIEIDKRAYKACRELRTDNDDGIIGLCAVNAIANGTPLTQSVLADALMEERIRGKLDTDTTFEKDIIRDVKCRLTVSIIDHRPCYCGAELREVWRESEEV